MLRAVPFASRGGVHLLPGAPPVVVAGGACFPRLRRRTTAVFIIGALAVATADALTATTYGHPESTRLALLRAAGFALMALGLATGVLKPAIAPITNPTVPAASVGVASVVVPLGAPPGAATAVAIAAALAALAALRSRRNDPPGAVLLALAFTMLAVAGGLSSAASTNETAAWTLLAARGAASLVIFADLARL